MSITGVGFLTALDILCDASFQTFEPIVDTLITSIQPAGFGDGGYGDGGYGDGTGTVFGVASTDGLYAGAQVVVSFGTPFNAELVTVLQVEDGYFISTAALSHSVGDKVFGPTFPIQQPWDPLWTQSEMLTYLATACNDFLTACPLAYEIFSMTVPPTQPYALMPNEVQVPERVAFQMPAGPYPLRETSQAYLDATDYQWQTETGQTPRSFYRDKVPLQCVGVWPRLTNTGIYEVTATVRQPYSMGMLDGFLFPDVFLPIVKFRMYSFAYSKDGESRNPGLAKLFDTKYQLGLQVVNMLMGIINDPNADAVAAPQ